MLVRVERTLSGGVDLDMADKEDGDACWDRASVFVDFWLALCFSECSGEGGCDE